MSQNRSKKRAKKQRRPNWSPLLIVLGSVLVLGMTFLALRGRPAPDAEVEGAGAPSLQVDQEKVDLGDMKFNRFAEVSFLLTNGGDRTLRFTQDPYITVVEGC